LLTGGHKFTVPDNLFTKVTDEQREEWKAKFSGTHD
jgi:methionyl-tRNA synthetase